MIAPNPENINTFVTLINNNPRLTIDSSEIPETDLYKALINAKKINLSGLLVGMEQNELLLLMQIIANSKHLNSLDLSGNNLDKNCILNCIDILKNSSLKSINISNNRLPETSSFDVIEAAQTIPLLQDLNISVDAPSYIPTHVTLYNGIIVPTMPDLAPVGSDLDPYTKSYNEKIEFILSDTTNTTLEQFPVLTRINWTNTNQYEVCPELRNYTYSITELNRTVIQSQIQVLGSKFKEPENIEYIGQTGTLKNLQLLLFYSQNCGDDIFNNLDISAQNAQLYYAKNFFTLKSVCKSFPSNDEQNSDNNKQSRIEHTITIKDLPQDILSEITKFLGNSELGDKITLDNIPTLEYTTSESSVAAIGNYYNGGTISLIATNLLDTAYQDNDNCLRDDDGFGLTGEDDGFGFSLFGN